jgi:hypothetical protein
VYPVIEVAELSTSQLHLQWCMQLSITQATSLFRVVIMLLLSRYSQPTSQKLPCLIAAAAAAAAAVADKQQLSHPLLLLLLTRSPRCP